MCVSVGTIKMSHNLNVLCTWDCTKFCFALFECALHVLWHLRFPVYMFSSKCVYLLFVTYNKDEKSEEIFGK